MLRRGRPVAAALFVLVASVPLWGSVAGAQTLDLPPLDGGEEDADGSLFGGPLPDIEDPAFVPVVDPLAGIPTVPSESGVLQIPVAPSVVDPTAPSVVGVQAAPTDDNSALTVVLLLTLLALIPTVLILATSFTRIVIVLGLTRNALGLQGIPPNQVIIGLALFLTIFVMAPVLSEANEQALQPFLDGQIEQADALEIGLEPFRDFMLEQVRDEDLSLFIELSGESGIDRAEDVSLTTLVPAFVVSELRAAFIIGFVIFVPFLVVDLVTSATLMSMGMVMLPPVTISLPFKLLLFVMVDGWFLLVPTLVNSFNV